MNRDRDFEYDVAFSLLARDVPLAEQLASQLSPLRCFVFTTTPRTLVGRNGVEAFAEIFRRASRVTVVLFRDGYGETDFTDLEARGIQDRALETRWLSPILINLDGSPPPVWLPTTNIWFDPQRYPIDDVVPVIRQRVAELGAPPRVESVTERVARLAKARDTDLRRKTYERSDSGREDLRAEISALFKQLRRDFDDAENQLQPLAPVSIPLSRGIALATRFGSVVVESWENRSDSPTGHGLYIKFFDGYVAAGGRVPAREPHLMSDVEYLPVFGSFDAWHWQPDNGGRSMSTVELGEYILSELYEASFARLRCVTR